MTFSDEAAEVLTDPYAMRKLAEEAENEQLLTPEEKEDQERRARRRMWAILGTLGGLGALGAGTYYYPQIRDWMLGKVRETGVEPGGTRAIPKEEVAPGGLENALRYIWEAGGGGGEGAESDMPAGAGYGMLGGAAHSVLGSRIAQRLAHRFSPRASEALSRWVPFAADNPNLQGVIDDLRVLQRAPETAKARAFGEVADPRTGAGRLINAPRAGMGGRRDVRLGALMDALSDPDAAVTSRRAGQLADALQSVSRRGAVQTGDTPYRTLSRVLGEDWTPNRGVAQEDLPIGRRLSQRLRRAVDSLRGAQGGESVYPVTERSVTPDRLAKQLERLAARRTEGLPASAPVVNALQREMGADPDQLARALREYSTVNPLRGGGGAGFNRAVRRAAAAPLAVAGAQFATGLWPYGDEMTESVDPRDIALIEGAQEQDQ